MGPHATSDRVSDYWDIWTTSHVGPHVTWSARPKGAMCAVVQADSLKSLEEKIRDYTADIDSHVLEARQALDALPVNWTGERHVQEVLIEALANLGR